MKPTDTNIAEHYGLTRQTIGTYKRSSDVKKNEHYEALKNHFIDFCKQLNKKDDR
ncbi:MAG: hypothetical protein U9O83_01140 [Campylobacterota bacterium]|nr:hypothetical protein [Campylobacterota bacterium]